VQDCASYGRLGTWAPASGGTRGGTAGKKIGNAPLQGAFCEAAALCLRHNPEGQRLLARVENKHANGNARPLLAHKLARAVSDMLKRQTACDLARFLRPSGRRAGAPGVSLDPQGMRRQRADLTASVTASVNAKGHRGPFLPAPGALIGHLLWLLQRRRSVAQAVRVLPLPRAWHSLASAKYSAPLGIGRDEGTA
jgi:hypothetical protein